MMKLMKVINMKETKATEKKISISIHNQMVKLNI